MKKTQIIIITIVLILTLGCVGTFAVLYFATDTFKSEQEMFYKYASQINLKEFIDLESYNAYSERLKTSGHANEGELSIELDMREETINESVKYNGYTDPTNKTANYDISINKDNETLLAMNYLNNQDFYGILFKDVVNQYIVFENNNLKEFASKMGLQDTSEIPNKIEIPEIDINDLLITESKEGEFVPSDVQYTDPPYPSEELNTIINKYLNVAMEEIPEENYSKIKKEEISLGEETIEADGYQVKLKVKDVQKILKKVLENARDDEQIYNLLSAEGITFKGYQSLIDEISLKISGEISKEDNVEVITISVYKQGKDTIKLAMNIALEETENIEISIEKTSKGLILKIAMIDTSLEIREEINIKTTKTLNTEEQENFEIVVSQISDEEETEILTINISRNGTLTSNNVWFSTIATMTLQDMKFEIGIENTSNFAGVPLEGKFEQGNHLVINGLTSEQITNLFTNLGNMLAEKLKDEMFVTLITRNMTVNEQLIDSAEQTQQDTQNALEMESQLNSGMVEVNGETYNIDEYAHGL